MSKLSDDQEKDAVDFITDCMYSIDYLVDITKYTFSHKNGQMTLGQFYVAWLKKTGSTRKAIMPFSLGIFLGYLYVGILYAKENWFDLLPEDEIEKSEEEWGLKGITVSAPKEPKPTIKYSIKRIRNSLGHGWPIINIDNVAKPEELFAKATVSFHDINMKNSADTFDITLTLKQLTKFIKKFQSVIHKSVREKI